jgi:hypothetical protein
VVANVEAPRHLTWQVLLEEAANVEAERLVFGGEIKPHRAGAGVSAHPHL